MRDLVRMPAADLEALYWRRRRRRRRSGSPPGGRSRTRVAADRGQRPATRLAWQGKEFRDDGTMINRVFGFGRAIPANVYRGDSLLDGQPSLILDYSNSRLWPDVRDEVREVEPGLYLGSCTRAARPNRRCSSPSTRGSDTTEGPARSPRRRLA
jgi:hypothetical protein